MKNTNSFAKEVKKTFAFNLMKYLKSTNKKQKDLAEFLDVNPVTVSKWITQKTQPNYKTLNKIASFLNITVDDLTSTDTQKQLSSMTFEDIFINELKTKINNGDKRIFNILVELFLFSNEKLDEIEKLIYTLKFENK